MNPTVWEVDARVLEPGDRFKPFHDAEWRVVVRMREGKFWILGLHELATEIMHCSEHDWRMLESMGWRTMALDYLFLESGRKVVVPVLPKSL